MNEEKELKRYKVIDGRNRYRDDPDCEIKHDNEKMFVVNQQTTDDQGNKTIRVVILNARKFQEERIVDEHEATLLILKGIKVVEIASA
jgi:nitrate/TMAO reductase-like tetraheme cytochrome c subunit